ncbi:MAG: single-stranded DNA-binding protein [Cyanobacteriota bacterium]
MNSCILMARIVQAPELRLTQENLAVTQMLVEFDSMKPDDPPSTLKVVGWGNLANDIKENYVEGEQVVIQGRLSMNVFERDGLKEKRAELIASRIHKVGSSMARAATPMSSTPTTPAQSSSNVVPFDSYNKPATPEPTYSPLDTPVTPESPESVPVSTPNPNPANQDLDDIPF